MALAAAAPVCTGTTCRYTLTGALQAGDVVVTFIPASWAFLDPGTGETIVPLGTLVDGDADFIVDDGPIAIDVPFPVTAGLTVDPASLSFANFVLGGDGLGTVQLDTNSQPTLLAGNIVVRYRITGLFAETGIVTATFAAQSFAQLGGVPARGPPAETTLTLGQVEGPTNTFIIRGVAIDVPYPVAAGFRLDPISLSLTADEFVLGGAGRGSVQIDTSVAPRLLGDGTTVRYRVTGQFAATGAVTATFRCTGATTCGTFWVVDPAGAVGTVELGDLSATNDRTYLDVTYAPVAGTMVGDTFVPGEIAASSVNGDEFALAGPGATGVSDPSTADPTRIIDLGGGRYRYLLTGDFTRGTVDVVFAESTWEDTTGTPNYGNLAETETFTVLGPTASLVDPANEGVAGVRGLNDRGYLDVTIVAPAGTTLDLASVTDEWAEFTVGGAGATGWVIDTTQAPTLVSATGNTYVFRYWTRGTYTAGDITITFLLLDDREIDELPAPQPAFRFVNADGTFVDNAFTGPVAPTGFLVGSVPTLNIGYLDVRLAPTSGDTLVLTSLTDADPELELTGSGVGSVVLAGVAPIRLEGTTTYRFFWSGAFVAGDVDVEFLDGSFSSSADGTATGAIGNIGEVEHFTVQLLTGSLVDPPSGSTISTDELDERGFFDVAYVVPAYADDLDVDSVTDAAPEFTVAAASGTTGHDRARRAAHAVLVDHTGSTYVFRYFYRGTLASGNVEVTLIGGTVDFLDDAGDTIPLFAPVEAQVFDSPISGVDLVIDVKFGGSARFLPNAVTTSSISITDVTITSATAQSGGVVRFGVSRTAPALAAGEKLVVTYVPGAWFEKDGAPVTAEVSGVQTLPVAADGTSSTSSTRAQAASSSTPTRSTATSSPR